MRILAETCSYCGKHIHEPTSVGRRDLCENCRAEYENRYIPGALTNPTVKRYTFGEGEFAKTAWIRCIKPHYDHRS